MNVFLQGLLETRVFVLFFKWKIFTLCKTVLQKVKASKKLFMMWNSLLIKRKILFFLSFSWLLCANECFVCAVTKFIIITRCDLLLLDCATKKLVTKLSCWIITSLRIVVSLSVTLIKNVGNLLKIKKKVGLFFKFSFSIHTLKLFILICLDLGYRGGNLRTWRSIHPFLLPMLQITRSHLIQKMKLVHHWCMKIHIALFILLLIIWNYVVPLLTNDQLKNVFQFHPPEANGSAEVSGAVEAAGKN